ncbi:dTDP-4-dehydrorhamnose reductase [Parabacteroides sp. FAFU027]|uniref:dTDP-4-dehydrorhamnose reductase n=1 Tax=Parabacteroides sp. FAFU027 TaxID=2922715 RepID=UPI001FAF02EF|nr:dTDP-4-dehydrorhamnose reductase [Parabacteroides sp. FAFU027]
MSKILVTGANGQLGSELQELSAKYPQFTFLFTDVDALDICDKEAVSDFIAANGINYLINCAAYTAVDKAEDEPEFCAKINRDAVRNLGEAAAAHGAKVLHVSTDYVFDGQNYRPYVESDPVCPQSVYGETKLAGEQELMAACPDSAVVRTAWLYSSYGNNFVKTMMRLGKERDTLGVIFDQVGTPTYAADLAEALMKMVVFAEEKGFVPGVFHYSNEGVCSWYDFARKIHKLVGIQCKVSPLETADYPTKAKRPHYSVLNKKKIKTTFGITVPYWEESLTDCIAKLF